MQTSAEKDREMKRDNLRGRDKNDIAMITILSNRPKIVLVSKKETR